MRKRIYFFTLILLFLTGQIVNAQVTIGSQDDPRVTLDVRAVAPNNQLVVEGFLAPQLTRAQLDNKNASYNAEHTGAIVFITDISGNLSGATKVASITSTGYYYYDGAAWQPIAGVVAGTLRMDLTGLFSVMNQSTEPDKAFEEGDFVYITGHGTSNPASRPQTVNIKDEPNYYYYNGTVWIPFGTDLTVGTGPLAIAGSTISHTSHTGDVTGTTILTIADNVITKEMIKNGEITANKLAADAALTSENVLNALGATASDNEKVLRGDGTWVTPAGGGVTYTAGEGVEIDGTEISHIAHTGDVTGTTDLTIAPNAVTAGKIKDGEVTAAKLADDARLTSENVLKALSATAGDSDKFLRGNGTWDTPVGGGDGLIPIVEKNTSSVALTAADLIGSTTIIMVTSPGNTGVPVTLPTDMTSADRGKIIRLISVRPEQSGIVSPMGSNVQNGNGSTYLWYGTGWTRI